MAQHGGGVCGLPQMCVCHIITGDKNRPVVKVLFPLHPRVKLGLLGVPIIRFQTKNTPPLSVMMDSDPWVKPDKDPLHSVGPLSEKILINFYKL